MEIATFKRGSISKGNLYQASSGIVWMARQDIADAKAEPRAGAYWKLWASEEAYEAIQKLIKELEQLKTPPMPPPIIVNSDRIVEINMADRYGIGGGKNNSAGLIAFNNDFKFKRDLHLNIRWPKEQDLVYSFNAFMQNIISYSNFCNNCTFQTDYTGDDIALQFPAAFGNFLWISKKDDTWFPRFGTVKAGSNVLPNVGNLQHLKKGQRIGIGGFDQIGNGFPWGVRYTEYGFTIIDFDGNNLILDRPIENSYNEKWRDASPEIAGPGMFVGKPRIIQLDTPDFSMAKEANWFDFHFRKPVNGHPKSSGACQILADKVLMERFSVDGDFWISMSGDNVARDGHIYSSSGLGIAELDKMVRSFRGERLVFDVPVTNGSSINEIHFDNCQFNKGVAIAPRIGSIKNSTIVASSKFGAPLGKYPTQYPGREFTIENLKFEATDNHEDDIAIQIGVITTFEIPSHSIDTDIIIPAYDPKTGDLYPYDHEPSTDILRQAEENYTEIFKAADGTNRGKITEMIYDDELRSHIVKGTWPEPFKKGEVIAWRPLSTVVNRGGHTFDEKFGVPYSSLGRGLSRIRIDRKENYFDIYDFVESITIEGTGIAYVPSIDKVLVDDKVKSIELKGQFIGRIAAKSLDKSATLIVKYK